MHFTGRINSLGTDSRRQAVAAGLCSPVEKVLHFQWYRTSSKYIKAIRVWPGDGRFFTSRTRSRFPLMFCLPAAGGSRFSSSLAPTVQPFVRIPLPATLTSLPSFLLSLAAPVLLLLSPCQSPFPPWLSSYISFIDVFTPPTHVSRCTYALCSATCDRNHDTPDKKS
mgnify:CR=1 FL=1